MTKIALLIAVLFAMATASAAPGNAGGAVTDTLPGDSVRVTTLKEFVVTSGKQKYSKKNNPAYELMKRVRSDRKKTDPADNKYYSYDTYDRISLGLNNFVIPEDGRDRKWGFMADYADTAVNTGLPVLLVSVKERTATTLNTADPRRHKTVVTGRKSDGIDHAFDQKNIATFLEDVLRETDIYANDLKLMQNRFVSPLSDLADDYYRYYIYDTIPSPEGPVVELSFAPRTPESFSFNGKLYVAFTDSTAWVKSVSMRVPRVINLNYIDNIFIKQEYELDTLGKRHKTLDDMSMELQVLPGTQPFYCRRVTTHSGFSYEPHPTLGDYLDRIGNDFELEEAGKRNDDFWDDVRLVPMSSAEKQMGSLIGKMRRLKWFYWCEKILAVIVEGWYKPTPKWSVAFGPVNTLISYNSAEGVRLRLGAMTNANLSPHFFMRGYGAYGFRDRKWKYMGELEYSLTPKKEHAREFPINSLRLMHKYDIDMLGQHYLFTNAENVFLSWKRKKSYPVTYQRLSQLEYRLELPNNFSVAAGLKHQIQEATPWAQFVNGYGTADSRFSQANFYVELRYAPGEKFLQGKTMRVPVNMDAPIFQLTHEYGPRKLLGSSFTLNRTELSVFKRFWFSAFGYADVLLQGGKIWSKVQYPSLLWPNANLSYTIQPQSYSLMNPMEFPLDYYGSLDLTYWGNGVLFNRIPLVKKLDLREVITYKMLMGGLTRKNNPAYNQDLYRFPAQAGTTTLGATPYMEISAGIDNILTILRIDYVWRLSYRHRPDIDKSGLRISLHFTF